MKDVAVVAFAQRQEAAIPHESEVEFMVPLMDQVKKSVGLTQQDMGFTCSGSSPGRTGVFVRDDHRRHRAGAADQ